MTTMPPESSAAATVLPITITATTTCDYVDSVAQCLAEEDDAYSSSNPMRMFTHNESALDALAALAAASTAVSQCPDELPASHQQHQQHQSSQQITPHQDLTLENNDANSMPPPPSRSPMAILAASAESIGAGSEPSAPSTQTYATYHHDYPSPPSTTSSYIGGGRLRSASNPEGMEKWDLYAHRNDRQHFVLPSSILEEELASTRRVLGEIVDETGEYGSSNSVESTWGISHGFTLNSQDAIDTSSSAAETATSAKGKSKGGFLQHYATSDAVRKSKRSSRLGTSPDSVSGLVDTVKSTTKNSSSSSSDKSSSSGSSKSSRKKATRSPSPSDIILKSPPSDEDDEANLEPEELLRRARARLLEDLSEGTDGNNGSNGGGLNAENKASALILPHSLTKYKEVYNKNGRIGVYTPAERAAIIHKFNAKRARRVWNKKIRYNCRKNLADRRMRVKGRFVKRGTEAAEDSPPPPEEEEEDDEVKQWAMKAGTKEIVKAKSASRSGSSPFSGSPLCTVNEEGEDGQPMDEDMPDVDDEDAGFEPSEDMPFRRPRRYTIT